MKWTIIIILSVAIMVGGWYLYGASMKQSRLDAAINAQNSLLPGLGELSCGECRDRGIPPTIWKYPMPDSPAACTPLWGSTVGVSSASGDYYLVSIGDCVGYINQKLVQITFSSRAPNLSIP